MAAVTMTTSRVAAGRPEDRSAVAAGSSNRDSKHGDRAWLAHRSSLVASRSWVLRPMPRRSRSPVALLPVVDRHRGHGVWHDGAVAARAALGGNRGPHRRAGRRRRGPRAQPEHARRADRRIRDHRRAGARPMRRVRPTRRPRRPRSRSASVGASRPRPSSRWPSMPWTPMSHRPGWTMRIAPPTPWQPSRPQRPRPRRLPRDPPTATGSATSRSHRDAVAPRG